jgi:X-X-X-Leu-X-X-Gly heptad repeat protein
VGSQQFSYGVGSKAVGSQQISYGVGSLAVGSQRLSYGVGQLGCGQSAVCLYCRVFKTPTLVCLGVIPSITNNADNKGAWPGGVAKQESCKVPVRHIQLPLNIFTLFHRAHRVMYKTGVPGKPLLVSLVRPLQQCVQDGGARPPRVHTFQQSKQLSMIYSRNT